MNNTNASVPVILSGNRSFTLSLHVAGGIIIATILLTCCCTLIVRHKCARCFHKFTGKRKKEEMQFLTFDVHVSVIAMTLISRASGTIDVNLSELEYLAARLGPYECRRLVAALHYTTYDLPKNLAAAERKVDEEIPCLRQLLHWNSSPAEGRGKTHTAIIRRLRQLSREDLADWLGKTAFKQLGKDLDNAIALSFVELAKEETETSTLFTTPEPLASTGEEDSWLPIDTILMALVLGLSGTLFVLIAAIIIHTVKGGKS